MAQQNDKKIKVAFKAQKKLFFFFLQVKVMKN